MHTPNFSYWEHQTFFGLADVVIIGGGLVGLTTAVYVRQLRPDWRVVVLERGVLPTGASTKNAGFACFGSVSELIEQEKRGNLLAVVEARWEGLRRLRELLGDAALRYEPSGNYEIFRRGEDDELARTCLERLAYYDELLAPALGTSRIYHDATYRAAEFGFSGIHAIIANAHEGALDTGRMMAALLGRACAGGVTVLAGCGALGLETEPDGTTTVLTTVGPGIRAARVVVATNAFAPELLPGIDVTPGRGQVLVTEPLPDLPPWPGPIHYDRGYTYARLLPDPAGPRILLGGGRHLDIAAEATTAPGLTAPVQHYLERLLATVLLPHRPAPRIDYRWSGVMAFGPALEPLVAWVRPGVLAAVRCNGMGVAMGAGTGWRAAELVAAG